MFKPCHQLQFLYWYSWFSAFFLFENTQFISMQFKKSINHWGILVQILIGFCLVTSWGLTFRASQTSLLACVQNSSSSKWGINCQMGWQNWCSSSSQFSSPTWLTICKNHRKLDIMNGRYNFGISHCFGLILTSFFDCQGTHFISTYFTLDLLTTCLGHCSKSCYLFDFTLLKWQEFSSF